MDKIKIPAAIAHSLPQLARTINETIKATQMMRMKRDKAEIMLQS
jgi:hypothetical protein